MSDVYSTYETKARFSEILRRVRDRGPVVITSHGKPVARIVPYQSDPKTPDDRLSQHLTDLRAARCIEEAQGECSELRPLHKRPGALERFLQDRE